MKKSQLLNFFRVTLLLLIFSAFSSSALGATISGGTKLYFKPNSNWKSANARFAMYLCNGSSAAKWYSMSDGDGDGIYSATVSDGESHANVIFCRMNPSSTTNEWSNRWNSTCDLTYDGTNNYYDMSSSTEWGKGNNDDNCEDLTDNNKWSTYSAGGSGDIGADCTTTTIYFKNTVGWSSVYAYLYNGPYWDNSSGSGSNGIKAGPLEMKSCDGIGGKDAIYSCTYSAGHSGYISFTESKQENYNNFNETKAAYRGDLCGTTGNMFVPSTTPSGTYNSGKTTYYNNGSWEIYDGECSGGTPLPDSRKEGCSTIEIYSKNDYRLYVFKDGHALGLDWGETQKGEQINVKGTDYYKWTICKVDDVQIIFQDGDKQSGDSPKLYGGYAYFFDGQYVSDSRPVPNPARFEDVDCSKTSNCYITAYTVCDVEDVDVPELPAGIVCDENNKKVLFFEDFGTLSGEKSRKQNNTVDSEYSEYCGTELFVTSYKFVDECKKIKNAGDYAIVVNPKYSGCTDTSNNDRENTCDCNDLNDRLWYKECGDHTGTDDKNGNEAGSKGGMLQFDCRNGSNCDVLYQRTLSNVCENTFLNFSAWITKANISDTDPIKARFLLRKGGGDGEIIGKKDVEDINLDDGWVQISAMFNTGTLNANKQITVQLINLAPYGQNGNDILLDDLELAACTPKASLVCSDGVSTEATILAGTSETLTSHIMSGIMEDPYYLWLTSEDINADITQWDVVDNPAKTVLTVTPTTTTYYKVIISNTKEEAEAVYKKETSTACGMHAITNTVTVNVDVKDLVLTSAISDGDICVDGVDNNVITLTLKNPRLVTATNVKVALANIENLNITKVSGTGTYFSGVWTVGTLADAADDDATASIELKITSNTSVTTSVEKIIKAYVSTVDDDTYSSYANAPASSKATSTLNLRPVPAAPTLINNGVYNECATAGNVALSTLASGTNLKFYSDEALSTPVTVPFSASTVVTDKKYYVTQTNASGCTGSAATISVTVKQNPTLNSITVDKNAICKDESTAKLTYNISGGAAPYELEIKRTENGETKTVTATDLGESGESSVEGKYTLNPSSDATYKFVKVTDSNGCSSESSTGLVDDVEINVTSLKIVTDLQNETICADKNITYNITASGDDIHYKWYESIDNGENYSVVGEDKNEYTTGEFKLGDNKKYKVEVYQDSKVCNLKQSESTVTVQDCSKLSLSSDITGGVSSVCEGGEITLNYSITNNAQEDAKDVIVTIIGLSKQTLETEITGYDHSTGIWNVGTLGKGETANLSITIKGTTVVKDDPIIAYISQSGSTTYDVDAPGTIKVSKTITVKKYTDAPTLFSETYRDCPKEGTIELNTQIATPTDKNGLKFYTTKTGTETATQASKNAEGTTTYWVTNSIEGECESKRTQLDIVVYSQPTATLTGDTTICKSGSAALTIDLTGTEKYKITLSNGDTKPEVSGTSTTMTVSPESTTSYSITEVTDDNGCKATLYGSATVTVNDKPTISFGTDGNLPADICAGQKYQLPSVTAEANGSTIDSDSEGWYLGATKISLGEGKYSYSGGTKITLDQGKYYTFSVKDIDKSLVYKAVNDCGETFKEFRSELDVKDCANFTITYSLDKKQVCKGEEVVLTATITNNSDSELRDVILSQSWDGSQIPSKDAAGTNKKIFVTSGDVSSVYDEDNNLWKIETFTAHKSATLKITFSAQEDESFHIYMKESNDVTYQDDAENPTPGDATLDVLEISDPVVLDATKNYNGICPETSSKTVNLSDLVTRNATDTLHFYDMYKNLLTTEPTFDISTEIPSTIYYINRTEAGKCISNNPIPVTIEVYKPVTTSIATTKNTICSGTESDVNITVDGTAGFTIVYNNGVNDITKPISGKTLNIAETLTSTTTYKLISVTDAHVCSAKLDGTESVTITVNALPELVSFDIEDSDKIICDGESTKLNATFKGTAPFKFYINDVETTSAEAEWSMDITEGKQYVIKQLSDNNNCESELTQEDVTLTVESSPVVELDATNVTLNCNNPKATITASGANSYNWTYTDHTGVEQTQTGDKLNVQLSESGQVNSSTTYTVYGYSEKAKCKSASPVTVTVTENKRTPVVSDLVSVNSQDETIEGYKETQIINCKDTELFIKSTIVDNVAAGYSPDDLTYDWAISEDGDLYEAYGVGETISTKNQGIFRLIVTDNETGCSSAAKRIEITENKTTPVITVVESVTTKDPSASEAVKTSVLTCEYPVLYLTPTIESENEVSYLWNNESTEDYLEVSEAGTYTLVVTDNVSFCSTEEYTYIVTQDNTVPTFNVNAIYYLCPSDVVTEKTLSSLLPATPGVTYKFYNEAGEEIKDLYEISADASVTEYYVTGISDNGCESTKTMFSVDFARNVDFTLTTSQTSMMIGGNETVVTVVPDANSDIADTYTWLANGNELPADGLEYSTNLYLDTKFEVTATNRCDSKSQEAFVEVLWPTAFTPHNANGKNDDFAKGMHIIVFNRFYTKIFEGPDGWDGTINGAMNESESIAVPGVYYYSVQLPNGEVKKGTIEIVR